MPLAHFVKIARSREHTNVTPVLVSRNLNTAELTVVGLAGAEAIVGAGGFAPARAARTKLPVATIATSTNADAAMTPRRSVALITRTLVTSSSDLDSQKREQHYGLEHIAVDTDDYSGTLAQFRAKGVRVLEELPPNNGRRVCFLEAPDGVQIEVIEKV